MLKTEYLNLQPTEIGILQGAAAIFAAKVASGKVAADNEDEVVEESVKQAIDLAKTVEYAVKTKGEMGWVVIIQLGTNDLKARFALSAIDIGKALEELILAIKAFYHCKTIPKIIIISPPKVHEVGSYKSIYAGAGKKVEQLAIEFKAAADRHTCEFLDCYLLIQSCKKEGIHLPVSEHRELANRLTPIIKKAAVY